MTMPALLKLTVFAVLTAGLGALGFTLLLRHHAPAVTAVVVPIHRFGTALTRPVRKPAVPSPAATLPAPLRRALASHGVVVAVLYAPGVPGDAAAVQAARQGAQDAHVGFAALNVRDEAIARTMALKLPGSSDPSVLVLTRPGKIVTLLAGPEDRAVVAQAARDAR
jgi:hypothetical protein